MSINGTRLPPEELSAYTAILSVDSCISSDVSSLEFIICLILPADFCRLSVLSVLVSGERCISGSAVFSFCCSFLIRRRQSSAALIGQLPVCTAPIDFLCRAVGLGSPLVRLPALLRELFSGSISSACGKTLFRGLAHSKGCAAYIPPPASARAVSAPAMSVLIQMDCFAMTSGRTASPRLIQE